MSLNEWNEAKAETSQVTTQQLDELAKAYQKKYEEYEQASAVSKELYKAAEELEGKLVEALNQAGKNKYHVEGIGTFSFMNKMSVQTPKTIEDKKALLSYIKETHGETFYWDKISVNSQSLNKLYNEDLASAQERGIDPSLFHIPGLKQPTVMQSLRLTKER
jgi:hypothetical protein